MLDVVFRAGRLHAVHQLFGRAASEHPHDARAETSRRFWRMLRADGVEVRCHNPPRPASPFGWLSRDHRKILTVDGTVGFVTGLCVGQAWVGDPTRAIPPWRDTGVAICGPAVVHIEEAFAQMWALMGQH